MPGLSAAVTREWAEVGGEPAGELGYGHPSGKGSPCLSVLLEHPGHVNGLLVLAGPLRGLGLVWWIGSTPYIHGLHPGSTARGVLTQQEGAVGGC
jgi:hypothetical protein